MVEPKVEFYRHGLGEEEIAACQQVLRSLFLTTGPACARFEQAFAAYLGLAHAVAVSNCTMALELALMALDIGPGHEVITTPLTFISTPNAVLYAGATPVFVDVDPVTGNLDPERIAAAVTPRTKAVMPVHLYGTMCDMPAIRKVADAHGLKVIADCAHAVEATRDGLNSAGLADLACYSFYATKNLACGEGGALACADPALAERLKVLRLHGMSKGAAERYHGHYQHWDMVELGKKANLSDILASLLISQLPRLAANLARREEICQRYEQAFAAIPGVDHPRVPAGAVSARHLFTIWAKRRDEFLAGLQKRGIGVAVNYRAVHLLTYYAQRFGFKPGDFPAAESIGARTLSLPLYPSLTDAEVDRVIAAVAETAA
ncbi:MAG: DegT/DnrJ/EryC1/StrS aminotransferase family protein, partial [Pseudomonadota bacterium]